MPRTEQANQQIRDEQRAKILQAAQKVFARQGLAATMDDVAAEASVSHGLAYRYFDSKEAILRALVEQALQAPAANLERLQKMPGTPGERLNALITEFIASRRGNPEFYQLLDQVLHDEDMPEKFRALVHGRSVALQSTLRKMIIAGQKTGEVAAGDPDQLVRAIFASFDGLTRWAMQHPEDYDKHFPDAKIFLRMLKP